MAFVGPSKLSRVDRNTANHEYSWSWENIFEVFDLLL